MNTGKKLVLAIPNLYKGGAEYQVFELCKGLVARNITPIVISFYSREATQGAHYYDAIEELGVEIHTLFDKHVTGRELFFAYLKFLRRLQPDILQSFLSANTYSALCALVCKTSLFLGIRNKIDLSKSKAILFRMLDWRVAGYIANSQMTAEHFCDQIGASAEKRHCIYNGIDTARMESLPDRVLIRSQLGISPDARVFVTVSNMHFKNKGHRELLSVWQQHVLSHPKDVLVLIGGGKLQKDFEAENENCIRAGNLLFLGMQENPLPFVNAADVYVSPSYIEGFSNSIAEAVLLGKAVIATRVGGTPELLDGGNRGVLIEAGDTEALRIAMDQNHEALSQTAIDSMRSMVSLDHLAQEYLQIWGMWDV